jgi:nucleoside-diphosphate-sugar epimerase
MYETRRIFITGGAGYVGSVLVPKLLARGHEVKVLDLFLYGDTLAGVSDNPRLTQVRGDIRDAALLEEEMQGFDAVIHLACISNDPSFELDPQLGRSINYDAFFGVVGAARKNRVRNFIYASSSSVYGVKDEPEVTEQLPLEPLTDYSDTRPCANGCCWMRRATTSWSRSSGPPPFAAIRPACASISRSISSPTMQ